MNAEKLIKQSFSKKKSKHTMMVIVIDDIKSLIYYDGCRNICHRKLFTMTVLMRTIIISRIFYDDCRNISHKKFGLNIL